jgi:hypothetical protein
VPPHGRCKQTAAAADPAVRPLGRLAGRTGAAPYPMVARGLKDNPPAGPEMGPRPDELCPLGSSQPMHWKPTRNGTRVKSGNDSRSHFGAARATGEHGEDGVLRSVAGIPQRADDDEDKQQMGVQARKHPPRRASTAAAFAAPQAPPLGHHGPTATPVYPLGGMQVKAVAPAVPLPPPFSAISAPSAVKAVFVTPGFGVVTPSVRGRRRGPRRQGCALASSNLGRGR